jgi:hypothetical protein
MLLIIDERYCAYAPFPGLAFKRIHYFPGRDPGDDFSPGLGLVELPPLPASPVSRLRVPGFLARGWRPCRTGFGIFDKIFPLNQRKAVPAQPEHILLNRLSHAGDDLCGHAIHPVFPSAHNPESLPKRPDLVFVCVRSLVLTTNNRHQPSLPSAMIRPSLR